jgi:LexA DNA binding domain
MLVQGQKESNLQGGLSPERRESLDNLLETLMKYLATPEGRETHEKLQALVSRIEERQKPAPPSLSDQEERALRFIRKRLKAGRSPSVREVARALGLKSSRSGSRILNLLINKGIVKRKGSILSDPHGSSSRQL